MFDFEARVFHGAEWDQIQYEFRYLTEAYLGYSGGVHYFAVHTDNGTATWIYDWGGFGGGFTSPLDYDIYEWNLAGGGNTSGEWPNLPEEPEWFQIRISTSANQNDPEHTAVLHPFIHENITYEAEVESAIEGDAVILTTTSNADIQFEYRVENVDSAAQLGADYSGPAWWTSQPGRNGQIEIPTIDRPGEQGTRSFRVYVRIAGHPETEMLLEADILEDDPNSAPVAVDDEFETFVNQPLVVDPESLLDNDSDIDDETLTAILVEGPSNGTLTLQLDGTFTYTPDTGWRGVERFKYAASDGVLSDEATVLIDVENRAPVAINYPLGVIYGDEPLHLNVNGSGFASDPDGDQLIIEIVGMPVHASVTAGEMGEFTITPELGHFGSGASFQYKVFDGLLWSGVFTVSMGLNAHAYADSYSVSKNGSLVSPNSVLDNDYKGLSAFIHVSQTLTYLPPSNGTLSIDSDGFFTYVPNANFTGIDTFGYWLRQPWGGTYFDEIGWVTVTVTP